MSTVDSCPVHFGTESSQSEPILTAQFGILRADIAKVWAKLEMVKVNFPSFFVWSFKVLWVEAVMMVFFSFLVINRTWYQGRKFMPKNAFSWMFDSLKIDSLLANFIKAQETGWNPIHILATYHPSTSQKCYKIFSLFPGGALALHSL